MYFSYPPLEAGLSTSMLCFLFTLARKLLFLLDVLGSYCFLFTLARKLLFIIYTCQEAFVYYLHLLGSYYFLFTRD